MEQHHKTVDEATAKLFTNIIYDKQCLTIDFLASYTGVVPPAFGFVVLL